MKTEQVINLTPPINGVQYGISDEPIKKGDIFLCPVGDLFEIKQTPMDLHNPEYKKLILSTNPTDIRFPYLVLPSKEQEDELLLEIYRKSPYLDDILCIPVNNATKIQKDALALMKLAYNANPAKYTQEQMIKAIAFGIGRMLKNEGMPDKYELNTFFQSLQPTAKAVRVEMESYEDFIKSNPEIGQLHKIKVETSSEHSQGIVRAIEVIY